MVQHQKTTSRIYSRRRRQPVEFTQTVRITLLFFHVLQISLLFVLFHQKNLQLTVQKCYLFYFIVHLSKENLIAGYRWVLVFFF